MSLRLRAHVTCHSLRPFNIITQTSLRTIQARNASGTKDWEGRQSHEHITNQDDKLNVQASASNSAQEDRSKGTPGQSGGGLSQATTEKDKGNQNEQAQKDHPEAPGPVMGMNDERGGMGHKR